MFLAEFDSVCQPDPTTMQQLIDKGAVTSGRGQGKISSKELCMLKLHGTSTTYRCTTQSYCFHSHSFVKIGNKIKTLQLLHQYTKSFMVSLIYEGLMSSNFMYVACFC